MKRHISTAQILREFDEAGKVSVIRYDAEGKRRGTYAGLCLNAAFREVVAASNKGLRVVVVRSEGVRETGLRLFHSSPGAATLQLRHDSGKRHTSLSASLELDELKALRGMVDAVIAQIGKKS